jgi:hypothetical protein
MKVLLCIVPQICRTCQFLHKSRDFSVTIPTGDIFLPLTVEAVAHSLEQLGSNVGTLSSGHLPRMIHGAP